MTLTCWATSCRRHRACTHVSRNSTCGDAAIASESAPRTVGTAAVGAPAATADTCAARFEDLRLKHEGGLCYAVCFAYTLRSQLVPLKDSSADLLQRG